ncbi:MAG: hypothetical protein JWO73_608 [Candidatus Taylorbacteria bacterium]|nr:hypothetical protein [Candidatus Taylorbacteria bacterium]
MNSTLSVCPKVTRSWTGLVWHWNGWLPMFRLDVFEVSAQQVPNEDDRTGMTCLARVEIKKNGTVIHVGCCPQESPVSAKLIGHQVSQLAKHPKYAGTELRKIMEKFCSVCPGPVSRWEPRFGKMPSTA